jgi:peptidoglycan hydrolase-like protein with peptidoglycan-binding domain
MSYLRKGVSGEPVRLLQAKLGVPTDGDFGPATEAALKAYQQKNGLAADGVAGPDTFVRLGLGELVLLTQGARGDTVKKLQTALGLPADGQFGPATEKAVSAFQAAHGLMVDGLAGPETLAKMPVFAGEIGQAQVAAASAAPGAPATTGESSPAPATLPSIDPSAPPKPAPAKSIWAKLRGWL